VKSSSRVGFACLLACAALSAPLAASAQPSSTSYRRADDADLWGAIADAHALDTDGDVVAALARLEDVVARSPVLDRREVAHLADAAQRLRAPGTEPEWFYVGLPLLIGGVVMGGVTFVANALACPHGCGEGEHQLFYYPYAISGVLAFAGLLLNVIGLGAHTLDPERMAFEARRRPLVAAIRRSIRTGQLSFSF
jgi:hypothetical protein